MAYKRIRGIPGLVYVPEPDEQGGKHPCKDCFCCQWCSDSRCQICLKKRACRKKK
ncbi:MAG: hypothetical protein JXN61_05480 [Sedimentisphaerales bacterium]|nr:hypothetical protein [Sedimentisphaerales bacterium]